MIEKKILQVEHGVKQELRNAQQKLASLENVKEMLFALNSSMETIPALPEEKLLELLEHLSERNLEPHERKLIHELAEA